MYQRILVPTDGSDLSTAVIDEALELAETHDAEVHALYVVNTGAIPTTDVEAREALLENIEQRGEKAVAEVVEASEDAGVDVTSAVVTGVPYERILSYADDEDVDLIVMGTHGRTGVRHTLLGSVAERVIRHTNVPVMVVRTIDD